MSQILSPGETCLVRSRSDRTAFLVDGQNYFRALAATLRRAQRSVLIVGWDFHSRIRLEPDHERHGEPAGLGKWLNWLARHRRKLRIDILIWDFPAMFALDREVPPLFGKHWRTHPRVRFRFDDSHPLGGCHHEKIVVVDDAVAFVGGIDLTHWRWDTCGHELSHSCRVDPAGASYNAVHDLQMMVSGEAARTLGAVVRARWSQAGVRPPRRVGEIFDPWPPELEPDLEDCEVAIARTRPPYAGQQEAREIERLNLDAIAAAKRSIYIESQYFTCDRVTAALVARLSEPDPPEVVILLPDQCKGWLEEVTMGAARLRHLRALAAADHAGRLAVLRPVQCAADGGEQPIQIHAKLMIVDDHILRIGSSNFANRSMGLDTECDLAIEAENDRVAGAITHLRDRLLAEHLACAPEAVRDAVAREGSLLGALWMLNGRAARRLSPIELTPPYGLAEALSPSALYDPARPAAIEEYVQRLVPPAKGRRRRGAAAAPWAIAAGFVLALIFLALATPLGHLVSAEHVERVLRFAQGSYFAPLYGLVAFTTLSALMVPVTVLVAATGAIFPGLVGGLISMLGVLLTASGTFWLGRVLGERAIRRLAGRRLNELSRRLAQRGIWAVSAVRLVPVAPFAVVNLIAGVSHIRFRDFVVGTALGTLPGVAAATVLGDAIGRYASSADITDLMVLAGIVAALGGTLFALARWRRRTRGGRPGRPEARLT